MSSPNTQILGAKIYFDVDDKEVGILKNAKAMQNYYVNCIDCNIGEGWNVDCKLNKLTSFAKHDRTQHKGGKNYKVVAKMIFSDVSLPGSQKEYVRIGYQKVLGDYTRTGDFILEELPLAFVPKYKKKRTFEEID